MEEYSPPIRERETEDLLEIYTSSGGSWQDDAITQATNELYNRGYTADELTKITYDFNRFLEDEERKYQAELALNATVSYTISKMIIIFLCTPIILFPRYNFFKDMTVTELRNENFKIKYKQRLILLISGSLFWFILYLIASN
ncbi:MAG: hypothetical protein ACOYO1_03830 [Bacteroidales bacterium]